MIGKIIAILHMVGTVLGVGGAFFSVLAMREGIKSKTGDATSAMIQYSGKTTVPIIWLGIILIGGTGIFGVMGPKSYLLNNTWFIITSVILIAIIIEGLFMTFNKGPKLGKAAKSYKAGDIDKAELTTELKNVYNIQKYSLVLWFGALITMVLSID